MTYVQSERDRELADLHRSLSDWQAVFCSRLQQWGRNGPSPALRASIAEAAEKIGDIVDVIMNVPPPILKQENRYG